MHQRPDVCTTIAVEVSARVSNWDLAAGNEKWILITGQVRCLTFYTLDVKD